MERESALKVLGRTDESLGVHNIDQNPVSLIRSSEARCQIKAHLKKLPSLKGINCPQLKKSEGRRIRVFTMLV